MNNLDETADRLHILSATMHRLRAMRKTSEADLQRHPAVKKEKNVKPSQNTALQRLTLAASRRPS